MWVRSFRRTMLYRIDDRAQYADMSVWAVEHVRHGCVFRLAYKYLRSDQHDVVWLIFGHRLICLQSRGAKLAVEMCIPFEFEFPATIQFFAHFPRVVRDQRPHNGAGFFFLRTKNPTMPIRSISIMILKIDCVFTISFMCTFFSEMSTKSVEMWSLQSNTRVRWTLRITVRLAVVAAAALKNIIIYKVP